MRNTNHASPILLKRRYRILMACPSGTVWQSHAGTRVAADNPNPMHRAARRLGKTTTC